MSDLAKQLGAACVVVSLFSLFIAWALCVASARRERASRAAWLAHQDRMRRGILTPEDLR